MSAREDQIIPVPPATAETGHSLFEDVQALLTGTLVVALGIAMYKKAGLLTGGVTGVAFLSHYASGINFGLLLVGINVPFYVFAWKRMGLAFTVKSLVALTLVAVFTEYSPPLLRFEWLHPVVAGVVGGMLMGVGMLILFRHKASLGGFSVLALYLQETRGWRVGVVQMVLDGSILLCSAFIVSPMLIGISILGAVVLNLSLATNHKHGRYIAA
ncbi:YitT family protein [Janthinobacterium sp.]|uniref:YitT family protein n=1 Tax=Janthinobacterium sp. TaxID=1871054 RepID=UPI00293D41BC|nr:YitT family protein [Janthinobacterium sp.]